MYSLPAKLVNKKLNDLIEFGKVRDEWDLRITPTTRYEHNKQAKNESWKMIHILFKSYGSCRFIAKIRILAPFVWRERSTVQGVGVLGYRSARGETCIPKFKLHGAACWACCCRVTIGYTILENERLAGIRKCGKRQKREWTVNSYPTIARALFLSNLAWVLFLVQLSMGASFKCSAKMSAIVRRRVQHLQIPVAAVKTMQRLLTRLTVRIWFERKMVNWICCAKSFVNIYFLV